jgi:hypothetical protein
MEVKTVIWTLPRRFVASSLPPRPASMTAKSSFPLVMQRKCGCGEVFKEGGRVAESIRSRGWLQKTCSTASSQWRG